MAPTPIGRRAALAAYALGQTARVGVYWGQYLLSARLTRPPRARRPAKGPWPTRAFVLADLRALLERDWRNIEAGYYRAPYDLLGAPVGALARSRRYFRELQAVERRRHARRHDEVYREQGARPGYPRYYLQNFHYQSGGWLSRESAEIYDHQVEVLFGGGADAMRRQALVALYRFMKPRRVAETRLVDLACGTGRFLTFVKDNYPRLPVTALDLSPHYLARAREALAPWRGVDFVQAPAETTGLPAGGFEVASAIYLFHELPPGVRPAVAGEIARLLKPGGLFLFVDSLQKGDKPEYDALIERFPASFHEPYYSTYATADLTALFGAAGLVLESWERAFFSKVGVFRKPG